MGTKIFSLLFIWFPCTIPAYSQPSELKGHVVGQQQQPLASATVSLMDKNNKAVIKSAAGSDGYFRFSFSIKANYTLVVSHTGYKEFVSPLFELTGKDFGIAN